MTTPLVMGVVNATPDSFSDGGQHFGFDQALAHARRLVAEGADILDIGGESTRPGAEPVAESEEIDRVAPLIAAIRAEGGVRISCDTMKPAVARAACAAGADIWNDVTALGRVPESAAVAAELGCTVVLMHMQGEPATMQDNPVYEDVVRGSPCMCISITSQPSAAAMTAAPGAKPSEVTSFQMPAPSAAAAPVSAEDEIARILPVVQAIRAESGVAISIDTMKPEVMRAAAAEGAAIWNDVTALGFSPDSAAVAADLGCEVMLMHMQGEPRTMQDNPVYGDVVREVCAFLQARAEMAMGVGVRREAIWVDPGIGFGKTLAHNLELLANLDRVKALGFKTALGVSRKRFLKAIDPTAVEAADRLGGSLAGALIGAEADIDAIRVHDVRETVQALNTWTLVEARKPGAS